MNETLRINGRAALDRDPELLEDLPTGGTRPPRLALCVDVAGGLPALRQGLHARRRLGSADLDPAEELPSAAEIYRDHRDTPGLTVAQTQAELDESIRERMW